MIYLKTNWIHQFKDEPYIIYSELNGATRNEIRKIEIFRNGITRYAPNGENDLGTMISIEAIPEINDINKSNEFLCVEINKAEFEQKWSKALL